MKIYQAVQKLFVRDRQTGDPISLLSFLESRVKWLYFLKLLYRSLATTYWHRIMGTPVSIAK
jgi:hypothetical protein